MVVCVSERWRFVACYITRHSGPGTYMVSFQRDCMISHGMAGFLKERMFDASDAYRLHVCDM